MIAPTSADARDVMVEGESGLLSVCSPSDATDKGEPLGVPIYEPSKRRITWQNGAQAALFSAEEPERLRGPQHDALWADELAAWARMQETWDMAQFGLRLGERPQAMVTTTPKPLKLLKQLIADETSVVTRGSTFENSANLAPSFLTVIRTKYAGTRLGRQELNAEILDDGPGALWTDEMIGERLSALPEMARIVVAVDPSGASGDEEEGADAIGIVVAGKGINGQYYVIEDATCSLSPEGWGRRAVERFEAHMADLIVAERNFGGAMVEMVIRVADPLAPVKLVTASRGKSVRAEPIAAMYEQGRVSHVSGLSELETQMMSMTVGGYVGDGSPDRVDALVWALTELTSPGGPVFQAPEAQILADPIAIPPFWPRCYGLYMHQSEVVAVWCAEDPASKTKYLYAEYVPGAGIPSTQAAAVKARGEWIRGAADPTSGKESTTDGTKAIAAYRGHGLNLKERVTAIETDVAQMQEMFSTGRLKVFTTLQHFRRDYRLFRRDEAGQPVEANNRVINAARAAIVNFQHIAQVKPDEDDNDTAPRAVIDERVGY